MKAGDEALHDALRRAGNVILVAPVEATDSGPVLRPPDPYFTDVAADVGAADLPSAFETYRQGALAVRSGLRLEPSFALALFAHARGLDVDSLLEQARRWQRVPLPGLPPEIGRVPSSWWEQGAGRASGIVPFTIRYAGPPTDPLAGGLPGTFQAFSGSTAAITAMLSPEFFRDRIVLMGTGFHDSDKFRTPFYGYVPRVEGVSNPEPYTWMYGVEIHANALQNMLDGEYVRPLGPGRELLLLLLAALVTAGVVFWRGATWGATATVLMVLFILAEGFWTWSGQVFLGVGPTLSLGSRFVWLPIVTLSLAAVIAYVGSVAYVSVVEGREKRFIKSAFGKYVSPEVVAEIAEHPEALQLGGQKRPLSLLFSDLAGFTTLSEKMDPQELLSRLNEYLSEMTQIVMDEGGTLDKYIGDAIMAFWNAPKDVEDHADRALRTAILMQRRMGELNEHWRRADPNSTDLVVRIGINTGTVVVGNVGGEDRFDYSAIGDAVNLAARLEPANKTYDTLVMASEYTLAAADWTRYRVRELDLIAVKGKEQPVTVYEVLELADGVLDPRREEAVRLYDSGLDAYKHRDWELAAQYFRAATEADPSDGPSRVYLARCLEYMADPPPADWDFVVRRTTK